MQTNKWDVSAGAAFGPLPFSLYDSISQKHEVSPLLQTKDAYPKMVLARIKEYEGIQIVDIADWLAEQASTSQK